MIEVTPKVRTVAEACELLRISRTSLYGAIQKGQVKILKYGRSTRIQEAEIERIATEGLGASQAE